MKKVVVGTFISAFLMLFLAYGSLVYKALQTKSYSINLSKFSKIIGHVNHSQKNVNSINKSKEEVIIVSEDLSLKGIELKRVVEKSIEPTKWVKLFKPLKTETVKPILAKKVEKKKSTISKKKKVLPIISDLKKFKLKDRISTLQSGNEKSIVTNLSKSKKLEKTEVKNDPLEFYDYSNDKIKKKNVGTEPVTSYSPFIKKTQRKLDLSQIQYNKPTNVIANQRRERGTRGYKSEYSVSAYSLNLDKMTSQTLTGYDLRFRDDVDDIRQDNADGIVNIQYTLNNSMGVRRATLSKSDHYPTTVDLSLESQPVAVPIPLLTRRGFDQLLSRSNIRGIGGHVLIELDDKTEDVEIDRATKYERKVYLNKQYKVVEREDSEYNYILFIGVNPGNTFINFRTLDNQIVSKIIHISDEEIYYEPNFYVEVEDDEYSIFEENLLGKKITSLNVHSDEFLSFNNDSKVKKIGLNRAKINSSIYPLGTRKYHELKHLEESLIVGRWDSSFVDLPSESYTRYALEQFNEKNVDYKCMVQINITKPAVEFYYNGISKNGMNVSGLILDKDGNFYEDFSLDSRKIFLLGEDQGIINIKVKYADETEDYIQSYCSQATYLVEQL